ncbi:MAG: hypothetical protein U0W24_13975 [Bacteroidales bacterium]
MGKLLQNTDGSADNGKEFKLTEDFKQGLNLLYFCILIEKKQMKTDRNKVKKIQNHDVVACKSFFRIVPDNDILPLKQ